MTPPRTARRKKSELGEETTEQGEVGYIVASIKSLGDVRVGDTVTCEDAFARRCGNARMDAYLRKRADFDAVLERLPPNARGRAGPGCAWRPLEERSEVLITTCVLRRRRGLDPSLVHAITLVYALFHEPCRAVKVSAGNPELELRRAWSQRGAASGKSFRRRDLC